ncbi:MAG: segregation/condensation protein A [bacterium]|nr:segregation/condensation protein A [bacterium]
MDLPSIVRKPSWKQLLIDLVVTEKLDPWDIEIVAVADGFMKMVKEMEKFDFHIPANIILASAILLKYKSNALRMYEEPEEIEMPPEPIAMEGEIPALQIKARIPPKAPITLNELIGEMERVIKYDDEENVRKPKIKPREIMEIPIPDYDIEKEMEKLYSKMKAEMDGENLVLFSTLVKQKTPRDTILTLSPLLHLAQEKAVGLKQDKFWGEIFIKVNGWSPSA